ncbi:hypothetical protein HRH25_22585 [Flavisolibacter sp. BT320]|nr:hypothetical protein [Flavisolibacter longurius]
MRISFVPTEGHDYRTLIIGPKGTLKDAIDKSFALPLVRKVTDRISNRVRTIHYKAQNENAETTVIIESREDILTSITVSTKYPDFTIDWKFIDLKPTFRN